MKKILISLLFVTLLTNCSKGDHSSPPANVMIRLTNVSQFDFKDIKVNTSTGIVDFENLDSGLHSDYKTFELAYRYAYIELKIDELTYVLQPFDFVGETPLESGNYAYEINADSQSQSLILSFVEE